MKHRIYIDEVGNPDLGSSDDPNHRFLSLTGVIVDLGYVQSTLQPQMEALKAKYFHSHPDEPVIFHRKELVNARPPFEALLDSSTRSAFDQELLLGLTSWDYTVISVCIDKKVHRETYGAWNYHPYHYCLEILLERYVFFLNRIGGTGDVMAESRGGNEDRALKQAYTELLERGSHFVGADQFSRALTSRQLKVKMKANNVAGLQLADLLAHPSRTEILAERSLFGREVGLFSGKVIAVLQRKYDRGGDKIYGKKFL